MFSSSKVRLCQSVLVAQKAIVQALEVAKGQEVVLEDIEFILGNIRNVGDFCCRNVATKGHARYIDSKGVSGPPFSFGIDTMSLVELECWYVDSKPTVIEIADMTGYPYHTVRWDLVNKNIPFNDILVVHIVRDNSRKSNWTVGTSRHDRHEEPISTT